MSKISLGEGKGHSKEEFETGLTSKRGKKGGQKQKRELQTPVFVERWYMEQGRPKREHVLSQARDAAFLGSSVPPVRSTNKCKTGR